jgi:S1-C subfamily serine protease
MVFDPDLPRPDEQHRAPTETTASPYQPSTATGDRWFYATVGLLAGLALALAAVVFWPIDEAALTPADVDAAIAQALSDQAGPPLASEIYERASPSLVAIRAIRGDDESNIGTGVIINDLGQILTSNHVVFGADQIDVQFADGTVTQARLVTNETVLDIAVLSVANKPATAQPAVLGNPRTLQVGDPIYAIGNPLGLTGSISAGIISGLNRDIPFPGDEGLIFENLIQFDAAVNQGSSGGPLLNADGHVVGIVTALADPAGQGFFIGIGFAVPIDLAASGAADGPSQ